jgi:hypothetical protein
MKKGRREDENGGGEKKGKGSWTEEHFRVIEGGVDSKDSESRREL